MRPFDKESLRRDFLKQMLLTSGAIGLAGALPARAFAHGNTAQLRGARIGTVDNHTQVVLDLSEAVSHNVFVLHHPERVVIDLDNTQADAAFRQTNIRNDLVADMRSARRHSDDYRVVLDLHQAAQVNTSLLKPGSGSPHYRLVVQLSHPGSKATPVISTADLDKQLRDVRVIIDPGHGGKDPGAIGKYRTEEKNVVLSIGHRLHRLLSNTKGVHPIMTRRRDHYLHLRERVRIAERHKADLFVSIHADANPDRNCKGSSVYILSEHGASSVMARRLAKRENSYDRIGSVNLSDKNRTLASVLLDLSQTATLQSSTDLGRLMLNNLQNVDGLLSDRVERAAFAVLKSPDIPSALVETAFISNPSQERRLRTPAFQQHIAEAMRDGIVDYFHHNAPPGTMLSAINRGQMKG